MGLPDHHQAVEGRERQVRGGIAEAVPVAEQETAAPAGRETGDNPVQGTFQGLDISWQNGLGDETHVASIALQGRLPGILSPRSGAIDNGGSPRPE